MPPAGKPHSRHQARADRGCLIAGLCAIALTLVLIGLIVSLTSRR